MNRAMDRKGFIKKAGVGAGALALPATFGAPAAFAGSANGHRVFDFVAFARSTTSGISADIRFGMPGRGTFKPDAGYVKGGGSFVLLNQAAAGFPKPLIAAGEWEPTKFLSYDTFGLPAYGNIQPSILKVLADFEGVFSGVEMWLICNVGAAGAAGVTGQPEGFRLLGTPLGEFEPIITPTIPTGTLPLGLTHISVEGHSIGRGNEPLP